jgi:2-amino-4-hydroxy-6-hydroxymethyldihydropteridine diphosphokinase
MSPDRVWRSANLGLGGNIGDPSASMARALAEIDQRDDCRVMVVSRLYRTPPWGKTDQDWFFNACARIETLLDPAELLELCLGLETAMNRVRIERWGPRTLDIDILTFERVQSDDARLFLPHPRIAERAFVLRPLCDYAPETVIAGTTAREHLAGLDSAGIEAVSEDGAWWKVAGQIAPR